MTLKSRAMTVLDFKTISIGDDIALPWTLQHLLAATEFINNVGRRTDQAQEWWDLYERAANEVTQGATMRMAMISVVGQKAS